MYTGSTDKVTKNNFKLWKAKTIPIIKTVPTSKNIDKTALANASIILLASLNLDIISPVFLVAKNSIGRLKTCLIYPKIISIDNRCPNIMSKNSLEYMKIELNI